MSSAPQPGTQLPAKVLREAIEERDRRVETEILKCVLRGYSMKQIRVRTHPPTFNGHTFTMTADVVTYGEPMNAQGRLV
jgi:hypothetical protein